jgi:hypothetical protein
MGWQRRNFDKSKGKKKGKDTYGKVRIRIEQVKPDERRKAG